MVVEARWWCADSGVCRCSGSVTGIVLVGHCFESHTVELGREDVDTCLEVIVCALGGYVSFDGVESRVHELGVVFSKDFFVDDRDIF